MAQQELVCPQLAPHQLRRHLLPEPPQALRVAGRQVDVHRAVDQRLPVLPHGGDELRHILEVALGGDGRFHAVGAAPGHAVLVLRVVEDAIFLGGGHLPGIDAQGDAAFLPQMAEQGQLLRGGGIAAQGQGAVIQGATDIEIRVELHGSGGDKVQEILGPGLLNLRLCFVFLFLLYFLRHFPSPTSLRRSSQTIPWSRPADNIPPAGA